MADAEHGGLWTEGMQRQRTVPCEPALRSRRLSFASQAAAASCICAAPYRVAFGRPLLGGRGANISSGHVQTSKQFHESVDH